MNIKNINNTNFQAHLDVSRVKTNTTRWRNVARKFNEMTVNVPGVMKVVEYEVDTSIMGPAKNPKLPFIGKIEAISFNKTIKDLFAQNNDETVAKKLIKLLNIGEVADLRKEKVLSKYQDKMDKESWIPKDNFMEKVYSEYAVIEEAARNKANRDAFLKNFEIIV